jgi:N-acetylmuramic acid 6-phosphate etherase
MSRVRERDLVIGITASGTTPFVKGALEKARRHGAATALVTCNPRSTIKADHVIAADTGAEIVAGSTRLKAGTATKLILNAISTAAMFKLGRVVRGRMAYLRPLNPKLRARLARIQRDLKLRPRTNSR